MNMFETNYFEIVEEIMTYGTPTVFNNNGNYNNFSADLQINLLEEGFPLLTTRHLNIKEIIVDVIGNVAGVNNSRWFRTNGCNLYLRHGLPSKVVNQVRKEDHELADEYCSDKGKNSPTSEEYLERFKQINKLGVRDGYALLDSEDITFWKDVVLKERGDLGITRGVLWRKWPGEGHNRIDQLKNAFDHLQSINNHRSFTVYSANPSLMPDYSKTLAENIAANKMGSLTSHVAHQYYTTPISTLDRVELYNKANNNKLKVNHTNLKEVDKKLNQCNVPKYYLDISFQQTNWDFIKDAPIDIAGYGVLLIMMAKVLNMVPRNIDAKASNVFINKAHLDVVTELFNRVSNNGVSKKRIRLNLRSRPDVKFIDQYVADDFQLYNYDSLPEIKMPLIKIF